MLNPRIGELPPSAFMILDGLIAELAPPTGMEPPNLTIGQPHHPPPHLLVPVIAQH